MADFRDVLNDMPESMDQPQLDSFDDKDEDLEHLLDGVPTSRYHAQGPADDERAPIPGGGAWLEETDENKLFREIDKAVQRQERLATNRDEIGKHYDRIRAGQQFSILEKSEDRAVYKAILPPGIDENAQPIPNKIEDLCSKIISQVLVDPPLPDPKADGDTSDQGRGAMDLVKSFLRTDGSPAGTDDLGLFRDALNINITRRSAFVFTWVDPTAGGWRPKQIKADPAAVDPANPMVGPEGVPTGDPILRYVAEVEGQDELGNPTTTQQFTESPAAAARLWLPKHRRALLHPNQVRIFPPTSDAFNAEKVVLLMAEPLSEAKRRFAWLADATPAELKALIGWRPKKWQRIIPSDLRAVVEAQAGEVSEDSYVFWYHAFCAIGPNYVDGGELAISGAADGTVLKRDTLRDDVVLDEQTIVPVLRDMPVSQFKGLSNPRGGDPFGLEPVHAFAGANESYAQLFLGILDALDRGVNPNVYIPSTSPVTREEMTRRDGTPIEILTHEDKPSYEQAPVVPSITTDLLDRIEAMMNSAAGTNETSNGLDSPYAVSGEAKKVAIRQAKVALAQYWQNFVNGVVHYWRVKTQLAQGRLLVPQQVKLAGGPSSMHKLRWFVGADLIGVSDIAIQPGTATMMAPAEKANYLALLQQQTWLDPVIAGELARASMTDDLGLPLSPHEERIDRAIAEWTEGPPPGWEESFAAARQAQALAEQRGAQVQQQAQAIAQASGLDPQSAMQMAEGQIPPAAPIPPVYSPFAARPNDEDPTVAKVHEAKLSRLISSPDYTKHSVAWRTMVDQAYQRAFYAAGKVTVRQQAEQAAAQQQAAAAQQRQQQASEAAEKAKDRAARSADAKARHTAEEGPGAAQDRAALDAQIQQADRAAEGAQGALLPA